MVLDERRPGSHGLVLFLLIGIIAVLLSTRNCCAGVPLEDFYPYNISTDKTTPAKDDGGSGTVNISTDFHFYDRVYKTVYISNNGIISFNKEFSDQYQPQNFPINGTALVAPFWADVDIEKIPNGSVWYGESKDPEVLERASCDIRTHLSNHTCFKATWVFVTTWFNVGYYGATGEGRNKRNTFQAVLISDNHSAFVMFNYNKIEWTTGQNSEGNTSTGLGGERAQSCTICRHRPTITTCSGNDHPERKSIEQQVIESRGSPCSRGKRYHPYDRPVSGKCTMAGYNAECCNKSVAVEGSATEDVVNLDFKTNVDMPGRFVYQLNDPEASGIAAKPDCPQSGVLTVTPNSATMLGGERIKLTGACLPQCHNGINDSVIEAKFREWNVSFNCNVISLDTAECIVPFVTRTGEVTLSVERTLDCLPDATAAFSISNINQAEPKVVRQNPSQWHVTVNGERPKVTVKWKSEEFPSNNFTNITIEVLGYKSVPPTWVRIQEPLFENFDPKNSVAIKGGEYSFNLAVRSKDYTTAVVRLCEHVEAGKRPGSCIFSDIFAIDWRDSSKSRKICEKWREEESELSQVSELERTPCPSTLTQAESDSGSFHRYDFCDIPRGRSSISPKPSCQFVKKVEACFQLWSPTKAGGDQICCYGRNGDLEDAHVLSGWGTAQRYHFRGNGNENIPTITNFEKDIVPMLHCRYWNQGADDLKTAYYLQRPRSSTENFIPPKAAQCAGDPHLVTLDDRKYTFNGLGEYVYIQNPARTFVVQVRTAQAVDTEGTPQRATIVDAVVMGRGDNRHSVEIRRVSGSDQLAEVLLGGQKTALRQFSSNGLSVTVKQNGVNGPIKSVLVVFDGDGLSVDVEPTPYLLNIIVIAGNKLRGDVEGLLGNYNGVRSDDFTLRSGTVLSESASDRKIHELFGSSWVVGSDSLFTYKSGEGPETFTNPTFQPFFLDETKFTDEQKKFCGNNLECLYDLSLTNNTAIAESTKEFVEKFEEIQKINIPVIKCDFPPDKVNTTKNYTGTSVGSTATFTCIENGTETINGVIKCLPNSTWGGVNDVKCIPVDNEPKIKTWMWGLIGGGAGVLLISLVTIILFVIKRRSKPKPDIPIRPVDDPTFDFRIPAEEFEMEVFDDFMFTNDSFWQKLQKITEDGSFKIPRPFLEDTSLYDAYF